MVNAFTLRIDNFFDRVTQYPQTSNQQGYCHHATFLLDRITFSVNETLSSGFSRCVAFVNLFDLIPAYHQFLFCNRFNIVEGTRLNISVNDGLELYFLFSGAYPYPIII